MANKMYPSDLTDHEWILLEPHLPTPKRRRRPRVHSPREILDAVFYLLKSGCQWRMLPRNFPPWKTVFYYFRRWKLDGTWERMNRVLRRRLSEKLGGEPELSAGIVDAQSVKTTEVGGEQRGFDGGKKDRGKKRHILVDTEIAGRGSSPQRQDPRLGRHPSSPRSGSLELATSVIPVGRRRVPWPREGVGRGVAWCRGRGLQSHPQAPAREGLEDPGEGVVQGRAVDGP